MPVTIITTPENASLSIDGNKANTQTKNPPVAEGDHQLTIEMPGYETMQQNIQVDKNKTYFNFKLNELSNAALMIESNPPGATFYLDGVKLGENTFFKVLPTRCICCKNRKRGLY